MKESEKLYNSFSSIRDEWLDDAISANTNNNIVIRKKVMPLRRLLIAAVVCVLCSSLAITCIAHADIIKSLFQREQELIDPYALKVGNSVTVGDITLTIDKVAYGGDYYVYYTFKNNNGIFDKGLTFDRIAIRENPWDIYFSDTVSCVGEEERGSNPKSSIAIAGYGLDDPSDTISAMFRTSMLFGNYKLAFENVTSYDGSIKYADEIVFDLELIAPDAELEPQLDSEEEKDGAHSIGRIDGARRKLELDDNTFVIEGKEMIIESVWLSPYEISFSMREYMDETVNYFGYDFYYSSYIGGFRGVDIKEYVDWSTQHLLAWSYPGMFAESEKSDSDMMFECAMPAWEALQPYKEELEALTYKAYITLAEGCTAEVIYCDQSHGVGASENDDGTLDSYKSSNIFIKFSTPVYEEEILEVYLLRESDGSRVTLYKKP